MGTDIHGVFQRHDTAADKWVDVEHQYEMSRHYQLFAVLADVRNGTGFAGCKTGEPVTPIAEPRGYPEGFAEDEDIHPIASLEIMDARRRFYHDTDEPLGVWMGDHTHSWLTGAEMLQWYADAPSVVHSGVFARANYEGWDKKSPPDFGYSGRIWGRDVVEVSDSQAEREATPGWTHIRCDWAGELKGELAYFFDEVARLQTEHGEVRFVFGFDS